MQKKITIIFIFFLLNSCGFSPINTIDKNLKYNLKILNIEGERELNKYIVNNIKKYSDTNLNKEIEININTNYSKISISKDSKGSSTGYKLIATAEFKIKFNEEIKNISFTEKLILNRLDDVFEEKRYETKMKENLAQLIVKKLIRYLKTQNDL